MICNGMFSKVSKRKLVDLLEEGAERRHKVSPI